MTTYEILRIVGLFVAPIMAAGLVWAFWVTRRVMIVANVEKLYHHNVPELFRRLAKCERHCARQDGVKWTDSVDIASPPMDAPTSDGD